ncbi:MAG: type IV pilus twitching motility protein PilT [Chthoniobacterales bacterium]
MSNPPDLLQFLSLAVRSGASDLHLTVNAPPMMRLNGELVPLADYELTPEWTKTLLYGVLTETQRSRFEEEWELDFALQVDGVGRFRGNAHYSRGAVEAAFRYIAESIPDIIQLGHWPQVAKLCNIERGLILVTGITGSGKSTTMASMVKRVSETRSGVIVTIEDPIEYLFQNARSIIKQREVGNDTKSFAEALKHVLRQDPDVILVGEMRDPETIRAAITAAETGHLVIGTLHTIDAPKAIDRMVDAFPGDQQPQVIAQLANCLEAIVSQRLIPRCDIAGRALASEILVANHAVRASIRERRIEQLVGLIEIGAKDGMHTLDESLLQLMQTGMISQEEAALHARDKDRIMEFVTPVRN